MVSLQLLATVASHLCPNIFKKELLLRMQFVFNQNKNSEDTKEVQTGTEIFSQFPRTLIVVYHNNNSDAQLITEKKRIKLRRM